MDASMKTYIKPACCALLAPLAYAMQRFAFAHPALTERVYTAGVYPVLAQSISWITGLLPFSLAEFICVLAPLWIPALLYTFYRRARRSGAKKNAAALSAALNAVGVAACGYFAFMLLCGFNYARMPYASIAGYDVSAPTTQELQAVCQLLTDEANALRQTLPEDENGVFSLSASLRQLAAGTNALYQTAADQAPWLGGSYGAPKLVLLSPAWAYTQITGMYFPFTVEANINTVNAPFMFAATMAHEAAHQRGFMREDEANFIAFYVCYCADDPQIRYSGVMHALIHATNQLYSDNFEAYKRIRSQFSDGVNRDLAANNALWDQYEGQTAQIAEQANDAYLHVNNQTDGVQSYGRMVDLLIGWYRAQPHF